MKTKVLSALLCIGMIASMLMGCNAETNNSNTESESIDQTVEYKFHYPVYWISDAIYSDHVFHLVSTTESDQFDLTYDIDENCKWTKIDVDGNVEDIGAEGDEAAAQVIIDTINYAYSLYKAYVEDPNLYFYSDDNIHYDKVMYKLIMKGYSTGEESATITEITLVHIDKKDMIIDPSNADDCLLKFYY